MSMQRPRYQRSVPGMIGAVIAVLGLIAAVWALSQFQRGGSQNPAKTVDYTSELRVARSQAPFVVLAPSSEPKGWRATSVEWRGAGPEVSWHLGFLTDDDEYVGLEQSNGRSEEFVGAHTRADQPQPPVSIAGGQWEALRSKDGAENALVRVEGPMTVLVTGTASPEQLQEFVESLAAE